MILVDCDRMPSGETRSEYVAGGQRTQRACVGYSLRFLDEIDAIVFVTSNFKVKKVIAMFSLFPFHWNPFYYRVYYTSLTYYRHTNTRRNFIFVTRPLRILCASAPLRSQSANMVSFLGSLYSYKPINGMNDISL